MKLNIYYKKVAFPSLLQMLGFHQAVTMSPYDYGPYSLWSKVSCQVGIELAVLWRSGAQVLHYNSFLKSRSVSFSFTALIKGVITMSYLWLYLKSVGEVYVHVHVCETGQWIPEGTCSVMWLIYCASRCSEAWQHS